MDKKKWVPRLYKVSQGIAAAAVVSLGMGILLQNIGELLQLDLLVIIGIVARTLMIPALGISISFYLKTDILTMLSATIAGIIGGQAYQISEAGTPILSNGEPIGALVGVGIAIWLGTLIQGKTRFDMLLVPLIAIIPSSVISYWLSQPIANGLKQLSLILTNSFSSSPLLSSFIVAIVFGFLILSPASSAALAIALQLDGSVAAAALIGCSVQFTAFAILSYQENDLGTFIGQLVITPKLQTANMIRKPKLVLIPILIGGFMAPIGVLTFNLTATAQIAGMGFCALVAPLEIATTQGIPALLNFLLVTLVIPAVIIFMIKSSLYRTKWLEVGDLKINV